jgi:hypothetical protein
MSAANTITVFMISFFSITASAQDNLRTEAINKTTSLTGEKTKTQFFCGFKKKERKT